MGVVAPDQIAKRLHEDGFAIVKDVASDETIDTLVRTFSQSRDSAIQRAGAVYGERNLLDEDGPVLDVCRAEAVQRLVREVLGEDAFAVRGLFFDKVPGANWSLTWHQDVTIAVAERHDTSGFGPWSVKAGVTHVHAPAEVLARMVAVRIHLDDCPAENGALQVIPGSHRMGKPPSIGTNSL